MTLTTYKCFECKTTQSTFSADPPPYCIGCGIGNAWLHVIATCDSPGNQTYKARPRTKKTRRKKTV